MNVFRLLRILPMPEGPRLRLRRYWMDREFDRERRRIIKGGGTADDAWAYGNWSFEYDALEEDEARFHSQALLSRARELRIMIPAVHEGATLSSDYRRSGVDGRRYYLSIAGEQKVRAAIREEEKYRSERWARRIPYITALSGLLGTATGLIALLAKWGS